MRSLSTLSADLVLLHAPAFYDFRDRRDIYFPFLGTSGDVPITPLYEYFPVGFKMLNRFLGERGFNVRIINLASLFIRYKELDLASVLAALDTPVIGIDLHWMIHVQGSIEVARAIKRHRPDIKVLFGGISSTYYARELIQYECIDMVMSGYDTLEPMAELMGRISRGESLSGIANLVWKDNGQPRIEPLSHVPDAYGCGIDWSELPPPPKNRRGIPIMEVLSTQNAGCAYNCGWCGGSRTAFRRIYGRQKAMARKPARHLGYEFDALSSLDNVGRHHFYSVGSYNEGKAGMMAFLDHVAATGVGSISYEQFHLTPPDILKRMVEANPNTSITLSPESHHPRIARLSGRGVYSNEQMEAWLDMAFDIGIRSVDIWYFCGMPEQDETSVYETVDHCERLLARFKRQNVNPMICPMIPFLDPASSFFESPEKHGYRVFFRTVEEHRRGMENASLINRLNYETRWLSRSDIVRVGYQATKRLMQAKVAHGFLPRKVVQHYTARIDDAVTFLAAVHEADCLADPDARARALDALGDDILERNDQILFHGVANQAFPVNREIGGRWFDELGWPDEELDAALLMKGPCHHESRRAADAAQTIHTDPVSARRESRESP